MQRPERVLGIQNVYLDRDRIGKIPFPFLLRENCVAYAKKVEDPQSRHLGFLPDWAFLTLCLVLVSNLVKADPIQSPTGPLPSPTIPGQKYFIDFKGRRSNLANEGVVLSAFYTAEIFSNPIGGVRQGAAFEGLLDLELTLDFIKMADWDGSFHASAYYPMGNGLTKNYTHDRFMVSSIDAYNTAHLFELWYEQKVLESKVALRVGQLAADTEFFVSDNAANFLNSTYGWPAIIFANAPSPNYSYAAPGVRLRVDPDKQWTFLAGVFSGNPAPDRLGDPNPNRAPDSEFDNKGTGFYINGSQGLFDIEELQYRLHQEKGAKGLPGTYRIGGWFSTDTFSSQRYDNHGIPLASPASDRHPRALHGNGGFYVVADQTIWQDTSDPKVKKKISLFARAGNAEGDRSVFNYYYDAGVVFSDLIPGRPNDVVGIATAYGNIGSGLRGFTEDENGFDNRRTPVPDGERNIELTYSAQLKQWWTVQPDFQYLVHPGGSSAVRDALVLGVRTVVTF